MSLFNKIADCMPDQTREPAYLQRADAAALQGMHAVDGQRENGLLFGDAFVDDIA